MARRGENIYKRKDGRWEGRYIKSRDIHGKIVFGYVYAKKYNDLKKKLSQKKQEYPNSYDDSTLFQGTVKEWMNYWLDELIAKKIKPSTYSNYRGRLDKHIFPYLGDLRLIDLTTLKIEDFINYLISLKLAPKTVHCIINILKSSIHKANVDGYLRSDPCSGVILPRIPKKSVSALSIIEQARLEKVIWETPDCSAELLSLYTGMRIGEISALRWSDIDFEMNIIYVNYTLQRIMISSNDDKKTEVIFTQPKTGSSLRSIPLAKNLKTYLLRMKKASSSDFVVSCRDSYAEPRVINYRFKKLLAEAGLPSVKFHVLRHTFATRCVEEGVDIATLSKLLGHTSIKMTLDTYTDSMWENREKAVSLLDKRIKPGSAA